MRDDCPSALSVDLGAVNARLLDLERKRSATPLPPSNEELERHDYEKLIGDGACPAYPIELLDKVARNPEEYDGLLFPWRIGNDYTVFQIQWSHWQKFRQWQRYNRGDYSEWGGSASSIKVELAYNNFVLHKRKFGDYTAALWELLRPYGLKKDTFFTDIHQQDRLTTWIEYLGYEQWRCSQYESSVKARHKVDWQRALVRWVIDQIPLIESEMQTGKTRKRQRSEDVAPCANKKQKLPPRAARAVDKQVTMSPHPTGSTNTRQRQSRVSGSMKRAHPPQLLRRSARLAKLLAAKSNI